MNENILFLASDVVTTVGMEPDQDGQSESSTIEQEPELGEMDMGKVRNI